MRFIELVDIKDDTLFCTEDDVDAANEYILGLATKHKVQESKLLQPPRYTIKRVGICYACYVRAMNATGIDAIATISGGGESRDINYQKARLYRQELDSLVNNLAASDFTAEEVNGSITVNVFRA